MLFWWGGSICCLRAHTKHFDMRRPSNADEEDDIEEVKKGETVRSSLRLFHAVFCRRRRQSWCHCKLTCRWILGVGKGFGQHHRQCEGRNDRRQCDNEQGGAIAELAPPYPPHNCLATLCQPACCFPSRLGASTDCAFCGAALCEMAWRTALACFLHALSEGPPVRQHFGGGAVVWVLLRAPCASQPTACCLCFPFCRVTADAATGFEQPLRLHELKSRRSRAREVQH